MAFLLDTNVVSELRRKSVDPRVFAWQNNYAVEESWLSVLTLMEIRWGTERVRSKDTTFAAELDRWYRDVLLKIYTGRILPVTLEICEARALLPDKRTLPVIDGLIGATAKRHSLSLVTRNVKDFRGFGLHLVNPWEHRLG